MAWSLVGHTSAHGATTSAIDTTGADLLIVAVSSYSTTPVTVSDSKSNTWSPLTERANSNLHHRLFYCQGGTVGSAHTFSTNANFYGIAVAAFSGSTSSPLDQTTGATASAQTIQPGSITPLSDNQLVVTSMGQGADLAGSGTDTWTVGSSYAISDFIDAKSGSYDGIGIAWIAQTTAAATNPQWDCARASQQLASIIASFKPAAGGSSASLTGQSVTASKGSLGVTVSVALTGQSATSAFGTLGAGSGINIALSGQSITASVGSPSVAVAVAPSGLSSTVSRGSFSASLLAALSGQSITASKGSTSAAVAVSPSGQSASVGQGTIGTTGGSISVSLSGLEITISQGDLTIPSTAPASDHSSGGGKRYYRYFSSLDYNKVEKKVAKLEKEKEKLETKIEVLHEKVADRRKELVFAKTMAMVERLTNALRDVQDQLNAALARLDEIEREEEQMILEMVSAGLID